MSQEAKIYYLPPREADNHEQLAPFNPLAWQMAVGTMMLRACTDALAWWDDYVLKERFSSLNNSIQPGPDTRPALHVVTPPQEEPPPNVVRLDDYRQPPEHTPLA